MTSNSNILKIVKKKSPSSILIVTGKKSYLASTFNFTINRIKSEYETTIWNYPKSYPDYKEIKHYAEKRQFDFIISFGGGTVIDVAKIISIGNKLESYSQIFDKRYINSSLYHLCIPTTFGSGSESTTFAVLYRDNVKFSIQSKEILPNNLILNHLFTSTLNGKKSYCSIMDSLCQSIESLWSINNNLESSEYAIESISLISKCLKNLGELNDINRKDLLLASNLSGKAINITKTTAPHAFSYYLTINHNICHGEAVSLLFEKFIDLNFSYIKKSDRKRLLQILQISNKNDFIRFFKDLKSRFGFIQSLKEIENLDINLYSDSINIERLQNNPVEINPSSFIRECII
tara:strand:- start:837 stop:1877 length:1041 start_codon:yes stop_codon:yes gene_type:complete